VDRGKGFARYSPRKRYCECAILKRAKLEDTNNPQKINPEIHRDAAVTD